MKIENKRMARGLDILKDESAINRVNQRKYLVKSQSGEGCYTVKRGHNTWFCDCPDYVHRKVYCKHIHAVIYSNNLAKKVKQDIPEPKLIDTEFKPFCCPSCHSNNVKKNGQRKTNRGNIQR